MAFLAVLLSFVFALVGAVHVLWALRVWWPIRDEARLAQTVVGTPGITRMPASWLTMVVVGAVAVGMAWIAMLAGWVAAPVPVWLVTTGGAVMAAILLVRGTATYVAPLFGASAAPAFTRLDRRFYAPLILALGTGVALLTLSYT